MYVNKFKAHRMIMFNKKYVFHIVVSCNSFSKSLDRYAKIFLP